MVKCVRYTSFNRIPHMLPAYILRLSVTQQSIPCHVLALLLQHLLVSSVQMDNYKELMKPTFLLFIYPSSKHSVNICHMMCNRALEWFQIKERHEFTLTLVVKSHLPRVQLLRNLVGR